MYVLDSHLQPLPVGVPGELMISSRQLARGYLKRDDINAEKFIPNPFGQGEYARIYRTGDLARWLPDGNIEFLGRIDFQVKLRGFRIELGEVENVLAQCRDVQLAVAQLCNDSAGTPHLVAYVTPLEVSIDACKAEMQASVPDYMVPEIILPMAHLPALPNGKVNRKGLPPPGFTHVARRKYVGPHNLNEEHIQDIWHEVLQQKPISVDADFFQIGGNSLSAGKVVSRIRNIFNINCPFTTIFQDRTIERLAQFVEVALTQKAAGPRVTASGSSQDANRRQWASHDESARIPAYHTKQNLASGVLASYSQELLIFNNELDPFNPAHNEPFWVRIHGPLNVEALYTAFLFLADRHTLMRSRFELADVAGPQIRMQRSKDFHLNFEYIDLRSNASLLAPGMEDRAKASLKAGSGFVEKFRRQATTGSFTLQRATTAESLPTFSAASHTERQEMVAGPVKPPMVARQQLAAELRQVSSRLHTISSLPEHADTVQKMDSYLKTLKNTSGVLMGAEAGGSDQATGAEPAGVPKRIPETSTLHDSSISQASAAEISAQAEGASDYRTLEAMRDSGASTSALLPPSTVEAERVSSAPIDEAAGPGPKSDQSNTAQEILNIRSRVKKALVMHYLTLGLYSAWKSDGKTGMLKAVKRRLCCCLAPKIWEDEFGGPASPKPGLPSNPAIDVPELKSMDSRRSVKLRELLRECAAVKFDLQKGPLWRINLFKDGDGHVLLVTLHHTITDGWSTGIICRELSAAYNAFACSSYPRLPPLPIQYGDYSTWQRNWLKAGTMDQQLVYWSRKMRGADPLWDFPFDLPRPNVPSTRGGRVPVRLEGEVMQGVKSLMTRTNSTMFMTLLAAFKLLLARYCGGSEDLCVGAPYAGRNRAEAESLIGAFLAAVAIRTDLSGNPTFQQLTERVRAAALEAFENADTPYHLVLLEVSEGSPGEGGASFTPLFQSMFFLHDESWAEGLAFDRCKVEPVHIIEKNVARFDLTLELTVQEGGSLVLGHLEYSKDLVREETAVRMVAMFQNLLKSIARMPETSIWQLPLVTLEERRQLQRFNVTPAVAAQLPDKLRGEVDQSVWPVCLDGNQQQMPLGVRGELFLAKGPRSMDLTACGPLIPTGLLVRFLSDSRIEVLGQLSNKLSVNAYPVQLEELESLVVSASTQVREAAVVVHPDEKTGKDCLVAFVSPPDVDMQALDLTFRRKYPLYMVPALFQGVGSIPRLRSGQVCRGALPQPDWTRRRAVPYTAPRNSLEIEVQLIWQAVIGLSKPISIHEDFSGVGGNMLHAVIINAIFRQVLGVTLPALGIFRERTIANLANTVRKARIEQKNGLGRYGHRARQPSFTARRRQGLPPAPQTGARWAPTRQSETELSSSRPGQLVLPEAQGHQRGPSNASSGGIFPESPGPSSHASNVALLSSHGR
ncbi:hypothetical protein WJX84_010553 [Apatococcus fuscideae]